MNRCFRTSLSLLAIAVPCASVIQAAQPASRTVSKGRRAATWLGEATDLSPCSLMSNFVDFQLLSFSQLNGAVGRGHAVQPTSPQ